MAIYTSLWQIKGNQITDNTVGSTFLRDALKRGQEYLYQQFQQNKEDVFTLTKARASYVDEVLRYIWLQHLADCDTVCLAAVGGYGRGELHPQSDIDLIILLDESVSEKPPQGLSDFLTQLWDIGLEIGHSVRTIQECREQAEEDITVATCLLESRHLIGHQALYDGLNTLTITNKSWDTKRFYQAKKTEQSERHIKYNDTANNLEPNIKESPGGLRDIQIIAWVAQQHFDVNDLLGLTEKGFIADTEYKTIHDALQFLYQIRFLLHHLSGRKQERLMIDHQREIATLLGYRNDDRKMAVEHFMRDYYRCAHTIIQMNELLLQLFEEDIILADEERDIQPINRRFQIHNGYLETVNAGIFAFRPYAMLELFLILQQNPEIKGVRASTIRQVHAHIHLIDDQFRSDIKNRTLFMEMLRQARGVTNEFKRMNEYGILGAYLPEFGQIVGQMQHDLFHVYTVDQHTLFLIRNLRRFSCPEFADEFPLCSEVFEQLPKPELIYIAGIYHDIAKGRGGDHSILGVADAKTFCEKHGLSQYDTDLVCFLVRRHLIMSATAQRQDIEDPEVIKKFAEQVQTTTRLNYLYLLTVADIRATNNHLWNGWRDTLLKQLYNSTRQWLEHEASQAKDREEKSRQKYALALSKLVDKGFKESEINQLWDSFDLDYFLRHSIEEIIWQTELLFKHQTDAPLIKIITDADKDTTDIFIATNNRSGIFAAITACLEQHQLDIFDAKISTSDTLALNTFIISGSQHRTDEIKAALFERLQDLTEIEPYCPVLIPRKMKLFKKQPVIMFRSDAQQHHTILELRTHDRPGLVSAVAQVFLSHHVQLTNAKLTTLGDQVEDVFFITTTGNEPLSERQVTDLETDLYSSLSY